MRDAARLQNRVGKQAWGFEALICTGYTVASDKDMQVKRHEKVIGECEVDVDLFGVWLTLRFCRERVPPVLGRVDR